MIKNYKLLDRDKCGNSYYGFYCKHERYLDIAHFDPWTGKYLLKGYCSNCVSIESYYPKIWKQGREAINEAIRKLLIEKLRNMHKELIVCNYSYDPAFFVCERLYDLACNSEQDTTRLTYIPTIRTFAFFRKNEKGVFDALDYCPFCGAKLPTRLDEKLSEILQNEYGLKDWHDYKKAPHEFHTNEWWIKRGL